MAWTGQLWMHPQQSSQRCFQTGFLSTMAMFFAGHIAAQVPQPVQAAVTLNAVS